MAIINRWWLNIAKVTIDQRRPFKTISLSLFSDDPLASVQPLLHSVLFWFSNCLEVYNFLLTQETLKDILCGDEEEEESPLTLLENMIHKLFEQIFYPVSKVRFDHMTIMWSLLKATQLITTQWHVTFTISNLHVLLLICVIPVIPLSDTVFHFADDVGWSITSQWTHWDSFIVLCWSLNWLS